MERLAGERPDEHDLRADWDFDGVEYEEEEKLRLETRKILELPELPLSPTCVRVPVMVGHAEAIWVETEEQLSVDDARSLLAAAPSVRQLRADIVSNSAATWHGSRRHRGGRWRRVWRRLWSAARNRSRNRSDGTRRRDAGRVSGYSVPNGWVSRKITRVRVGGWGPLRLRPGGDGGPRIRGHARRSPDGALCHAPRDRTRGDRWRHSAATGHRFAGSA